MKHVYYIFFKEIYINCTLDSIVKKLIMYFFFYAKTFHTTFNPLANIFVVRVNEILENLFSFLINAYDICYHILCLT